MCSCLSLSLLHEGAAAGRCSTGIWLDKACYLKGICLLLQQLLMDAQMFMFLALPCELMRTIRQTRTYKCTVVHAPAYMHTCMHAYIHADTHSDTGICILYLCSPTWSSRVSAGPLPDPVPSHCQSQPWMTTQAKFGRIGQLVLADYLEVKLFTLGPMKCICGEAERRSFAIRKTEKYSDVTVSNTGTARRTGSSPRTFLKRFTFFTFSVLGWMLDLQSTLR